MQIFVSMCRVFTCSGVGRDTGQRSTGRPYHDHRGGSGSLGSSTDSCGRLDGRIIAGIMITEGEAAHRGAAPTRAVDWTAVSSPAS